MTDREKIRIIQKQLTIAHNLAAHIDVRQAIDIMRAISEAECKINMAEEEME